MRLIDKILKQRESEVLDFKREFLGSPKEYLHNLLCLANSPSRQERYLVFGVDDEKSIVGLDKKIDSST